MLAGEFIEAALVFGLVLGDAGIAGDQLVDRLGGSTHAGEELVGCDVQVGGVEFGAHGLVDQLVDLVPADEEVVDGVEERFRDLLFADVRGRASGRRGETGSSNLRMAMIYGLAKALDLYSQPPTNTRSPTLNSEEPVKSENLYQIFAYVKNKQAALERAGDGTEVSGMLLYAATDEDIQPDATYRMSGNRISATTLDLDRPFEEIRAQLDTIADTITGPSAPAS